MIDVHPPRMSRWQKPFRNLLRLMRKGKIVPHESPRLHYPPWLKEVFNEGFWGLLLSVIPGLAHVLNKRFREIRWYFWGWLILLAAGLFMYSSEAGFSCIGLAIGLHAGIAVQFVMNDLDNLREKIVAIILALIVFTSIYVFVPGRIIPNLSGGHASFNIPDLNIEEGDYLLAWSGLDHTLLDRGSLVQLNALRFTTGGRGHAQTDEVIGQVVAFPGELVEIHEGFFNVNGKQLDAERYPVPQWLLSLPFSAIVPDNCYFISMRYNVGGYGIRLEASYVNNVCFVEANDIEARVFMKWWPLSKRGFLR